MRYFKLLNPLTLPRTLLPGMGNTHKRPQAGDVVAIPDDACARESRFVRGRKRAEDWEEIDEAEYNAALASAKPTPAPKPAAPIVTGAPNVKQPAAPAEVK